MKSIDQLVGKGISIWVIIQLIAYNLAWMVTLAVPMAVLVSVLMAFGNLSSNNEITVMKAGGISLQKLMIPVIIVALIITYLMIRFNNDVLPETNHQARILLTDISRTKPTFFLEPGKFSEDIKGTRIFVRKTFENSNKLEGIYIYDYSDPSYKNIITAKRGDIGFTSDFDNIVMNLEEGEIHQLYSINPTIKYRKIEFQSHRITFESENFGFQRSSGSTFIRGDRELSSASMNKIVDSLKLEIKKIRAKFTADTEVILRRYFYVVDSCLQINHGAYTESQGIKPLDSLKTPYKDSLKASFNQVRDIPNLARNNNLLTGQYQRQINSYDVEIYKKYSIPFACLVFALVGAPLGYKIRKSGFGVAAGLSLLFFLIYWIALIGGEKLADRSIVSPFVGMWVVNFILGGFGLYLIFKTK